jgi:hypothetical protein
MRSARSSVWQSKNHYHSGFATALKSREYINAFNDQVIAGDSGNSGILFYTGFYSQGEKFASTHNTLT